MIRSLDVKGLNKRLDKDFKFNEDLNVITGANGSGKTTVLKLIWYLISGNLERLFPEIPFKSVKIETDRFSLTITCNDSGKVHFSSEENTFSKQVNFTVGVNQETGDIASKDYGEEIHELNVDIAKTMKNSLFFPTFRRIEGGFSNVSLDDDVDIRSYRTMQESSYRIMEILEVKKAISNFTSMVSVYDEKDYHHNFIASISTHDIVKLLDGKHSDISDEVNKIRRNSSDQIRQKIWKYSRETNGTDTEDLKKAKELIDDIQKMHEKDDKKEATLFHPISVLSEYVKDLYDYGIHINERITLGRGIEDISNVISSDKLSSGEKQMLSFLCYNVFSENTSIFIDEPELSLHVDWQRCLFPTLMEQGQNNQFFVATHSPFIYTKYPDKEFMLDEDRGES